MGILDHPCIRAIVQRKGKELSTKEAPSLPPSPPAVLASTSHNPMKVGAQVLLKRCSTAFSMGSGYLGSVITMRGGSPRVVTAAQINRRSTMSRVSLFAPRSDTAIMRAGFSTLSLPSCDYVQLRPVAGDDPEARKAETAQLFDLIDAETGAWDKPVMAAKEDTSKTRAPMAGPAASLGGSRRRGGSQCPSESGEPGEKGHGDGGGATHPHHPVNRILSKVGEVEGECDIGQVPGSGDKAVPLHDIDVEGLGVRGYGDWDAGAICR